MNTAFIISEKCAYEDITTTICICSIREKAEEALKILQSRNKNPDYISYEYEEFNLDYIPIYL